MGRPKKKLQQSSCHPDRVLYCKKLCRKCYHHNYQKTYRKDSISTRVFGVHELPEGFYAYVWLREDGTAYYVGKGTGDRAYIKSTHRVGCPREIERVIIYPSQSESDAFETEIALIWYYGRKDLGTGCLRNLTDGGENPPKGMRKGKHHNQDSREQISKSLMGKKASEDTKLKMKTSALIGWEKRRKEKPTC